MAGPNEEFALGLNTGGFILFVVLLFVCLPLAWLPWVISGCKANGQGGGGGGVGGGGDQTN